MRTVAILQARMGSTRLPGKSVMPIAGQPAALRVAQRVAAARTLDAVWVATTLAPADDALADVVGRAGFPCHRGSEADVLDRYHEAAQRARADVVVRVTGDCPLMDPDVLDLVVGRFREDGPDYATNTLPPTYPDGLDVEVVTREALETAWREARLPGEREHVTPYIRNHPEKFRLLNVANDRDLSHLRWTLDTPQDLAFIRAVYEALGGEGALFGMRRVLDLLAKRPQLADVNRSVPRNEGYARSMREDASGRPTGAAGEPPSKKL